MYLNELSVIDINRIQSNLMKRLSSMVKTIELNQTHEKKKKNWPIERNRTFEFPGFNLSVEDNLSRLCIEKLVIIKFVSYVIH